MSVLFIILSALLFLNCVALVAVILMQKKNATGMGSTMGGMGGGSGQTYWDKNKGRSLEGQLENYTRILAGVFFVLSLALCFIK